MMEKAMWYVNHQRTHIQISRDVDGGFLYYFLREDNPLKITKISAHYIKQYDKLCLGHLPANTSFYHMVDICFSFHQVVSVIEPWGVPACSMNPAQFDCPTCKGFKSYGICSHVLAINHILEQIDVGHQLKALHQKTRKGGNRKQTRPAMVLQEALPLADTPTPALA